jgi:hypothetical protein
LTGFCISSYGQIDSFCLRYELINSILWQMPIIGESGLVASTEGLEELVELVYGNQAIKLDLMVSARFL